MMAIAMLVQVDTRATEALERLATAHIVLTVVVCLIGLAALGGGLMILLEVRATRRQLRAMLGGLQPHLLPLIDRATHISNDMAGMTDNIRRKVDDLLHTAEDLNRALRKGAAATEARARRFDAVLDLVQTEAEEVMLDAAATARGVHETARAMREPRPARRSTGVQPRRQNPDGEKDHE
jgi:hypothetical protein